MMHCQKSFLTYQLPKERREDKWTNEKNGGGGNIIVNEKQRGLQQNVKRKNVEKNRQDDWFLLKFK